MFALASAVTYVVPPAFRDWLAVDEIVSSQVRVRFWDKEASRTVASARGAHDAMELTWIESGTVKYDIGRREVAVSPGQLMVVPRQFEHATTFLTAMRGVALWVDPNLVAEIADAVGPSARDVMRDARILDADTGRISTLLKLLVDEVREGGDGHTLAAEALTDAIVVELLRPRGSDRARTGTRNPRVLAAIAQMRASYAEPLTTSDLAKTAGLSRFHFSRLFRDEVGQAPYQYLTRIRIARAVELLRSGHHSVTEAALETGFRDMSRFSRTFRAHTGKLPRTVLRRATNA